MHPRVVNVRHHVPYDVYIGRGRCPRGGASGPWGNPFPVDSSRRASMLRYLDWLRDDEKGQFVAELARVELAGKVLGCWCAPALCHGEVLARLADGETLSVVRADLLDRIPETKGLFE